MPRVPAFETHRLSADTHGLIFAATGFLNDIFAVGTRAPLFAFVLAYLYFLFSSFVFVLDFFRTKLLNLFDAEFLSTELLRARNAVHLLHRYQNFKVVRYTVDAEAMITFQAKEVCLVVSFVTNFTSFSRNPIFAGNSGWPIYIVKILNQWYVLVNQRVIW